MPSYRLKRATDTPWVSLSGVRIASHIPIHYKRLTAERGAKYIAANGVQHGATAARGYTAITVKDEEPKKEAS